MAAYSLLAEKVLPFEVNPDLVAYCPTMDLIALSTTEEGVLVYRLNGQHVFGLVNKKPNCRISRLQWKPNGQLLAIAFTGPSVSLVSAQTGKAVHSIDCSAYSGTNICCLGWGLNYTNIKGTTNLDHVLSRDNQAQTSDTPPDLPTDLTFLDIEDILPRLSALPTGGKENELFSSRVSLDAIFYSSRKDSDDSTDVLLVGFEDGTTYLSIYDFFTIGSFELRQMSPKLQANKMLLHASHPYSSTHALLASTSIGVNADLHFIPLDLHLIPETGRYLSLLASKSTQLQHVLKYVQETQFHIYSEFRSSQDLPSRFIRNIEEALQEKNQCSWIHAAYHLVVTGDCYPSVKEWLVDELGERGHKRWEKAVIAGYENVRRFTHENLIPALERFSVLVSRLRGLSKFQETTGSLGLNTQELEDVIDSVNCLQLLAHNILISAGTELRQFSAFSAWLRQEIDVQATDPASASTEESAENDNLHDHASTLEYIQGAMLKSRLFELLNIQSQTDSRPQWDLATEGRSIYHNYKRDLKTYKGGVLPDKKPPGLSALVTRLKSQCQIVFDRIAETQKRKVRFGESLCLEKTSVVSFDMRMLIEGRADKLDGCTTYIATATTTTEHLIRIHKVTLKISNGISSTQAHEYVSFLMPSETIKDLKFVDDDAIMVALSCGSSSRLISLPYRSDELSSLNISYASAIDSAPCLDLSMEDMLLPYIRHTFPAGLSWGVERLEINGRKGRRAVCAIAQDRTRYRIFDLDSASIDSDEEGGADQGEESDMVD